MGAKKKKEGRIANERTLQFFFWALSFTFTPGGWFSHENLAFRRIVKFSGKLGGNQIQRIFLKCYFMQSAQTFVA